MCVLLLAVCSLLLIFLPIARVLFCQTEPCNKDCVVYKEKLCGALFVFLKTNSFAFARCDFFILWTRMDVYVAQCGRECLCVCAELQASAAVQPNVQIFNVQSVMNYIRKKTSSSSSAQNLAK